MTCQPHAAAAVLIVLAGVPRGWRVLWDSIRICEACQRKEA